MKYKNLGSIALCAAVTWIEACGSPPPRPSIFQTLRKHGHRIVSYCEDINQCRASVGVLRAQVKQTIFQCTATLVSANVIMTNSHCVPDSWRDPSQPPRDGERFQFLLAAQAGRTAETLTVERLVSAFPSQAVAAHYMGIDVAFLKLKQFSKRLPVEIDQSGIVDGETLHLVRVANGGAGSQLNDCQAVQNTLVAPDFSQSISRLFALKGCPISHSQSGSPLLNDQAQIKGIVSNGDIIEEASKAELKDVAFFRPDTVQTLQSDYRNMAFGTNMSCVALPFHRSAPNSPFCQKPDNFKKNLLELIDKLAQEQTDQTLSPWLTRQNLHGLQWTLLQTKHLAPDRQGVIVRLIQGKPQCWLNMKVTDNRGDASGPIPSWTIHVKADASFRLQTIVTYKDAGTYRLRLPACTDANKAPRYLWSAGGK